MRFAQENVRTKRLLRDAEGVAHWLARTVAIEAGVDQPAFAALEIEVTRLIGSGRDRGINLDLEIARVLAIRLSDNALDPAEQFVAKCLLAIALGILGDRESGVTRLEEAAGVFRQVINDISRDQAPSVWAKMQNNLGNVLAIIGERGRGTVRLEEAVQSYRLALKEQSRDNFPFEWATTQSNLGDALRVLGGREGGTAQLQEAVEAFRLAIEVRTRDRLPRDWAATQNNLGNALAMLGQRENDMVRLDEAVTAFRLALEEWNREDAPLDWAMTQNNLGNALLTLGVWEGGTAKLEQAAAAYRLALEEWTSERVPFDWAGCLLNHCRARAYLHERGGSPCDLYSLRNEAEAARIVLLDGGYEDRTVFANHVIAEINRIIAADPH